MKVTVVGLGKIGLPLAVQYAQAGQDVIGYDINLSTVKLVNEGVPPFPNEKNLAEFLREVRNINSLNATSDAKRAFVDAEIIIVVVPLFVDMNGTPNFEALDDVASKIGKYIQNGTIVIFETTLPLGATRERFSTKISKISSKKIGEEIYVAFSPERVLTGRVFADLKKYPKIVGGVTTKCGEIAAKFYEKVLTFEERDDLAKPNGIWLLQSAEAAEFVKLAETTHRDVNIGLANQFAKHAWEMNLNIYEIIEAANSQPYSHIPKPGISVGGHCIPIYPQLYMSTDKAATIVQAARDINNRMPEYFIEKLKDIFNGSLRNKQILVLGVAYRENVKETAFSGAYAIENLLKKEGAKVFFEDPLYEEEELNEIGFEHSKNLSEINAVILHTAHPNYLEHDFSKYDNLEVIIDGRHFLHKGDSNLTWFNQKD